MAVASSTLASKSGNESLAKVLKKLLSKLVGLVMQVAPLAMLGSAPLRKLTLLNALLQVALFVPVVQIPAYLTDLMTYVDIGWPSGLVVIGVVGLLKGEGALPRRLLAGSLMGLHGGRMASMALAMMYHGTGISLRNGQPYRIVADLPRYQYAKAMFEKRNNPALWWKAMQLETFKQCIANSVWLAAPIFSMCSDTTPGLRLQELLGASLWGACWVVESIADIQKHRFLANVADADRMTAVLGYKPYDTKDYWMWTLCRHPNYFAEWMSWNAIILMALPSIISLPHALSVSTKGSEEDDGSKTGSLKNKLAPLIQRFGLGVTTIMVSQLFYVTMVLWTGAKPAEYFSSRKRPAYRAYQEAVRCFWPFDMPGVDHHRVAGWPTPVADLSVLPRTMGRG